FQKLINQGLILGMSAFVYRLTIDFEVLFTIKDGYERIFSTRGISFAYDTSQNGTFGTDYFFSKNKSGEYSNLSLKDLPIDIIKTRSQLENKLPKYPFDNILFNDAYDREVRIKDFAFNPIHVDVSLVNSSS